MPEIITALFHYEYNQGVICTTEAEAEQAAERNRHHTMVYEPGHHGSIPDAGHAIFYGYFPMKIW